MNDDVMIKVEGLWKRYGLPPKEGLAQRIKRYRRAVLHGSKALQEKPNWGKEDGGLWALRDVSFELRRGEAFGVIGRNGSGKSTLLKVLALTSPPTYGKVTINGRIFSMIELAAGMNPELSGRENVRLLATVMGFSPRWAARKMPEIEDFCELEEWFDRPVWQYSSGMMARLGFSVAINVEADVLLIDEVLGVGDLPFQAKSMMAMDKVLKSDATIILVSHGLTHIKRICNRAMLLDKGIVLAQGITDDVLDKYYQEGTEEVIGKKKKDTTGAINESSGELRINEIVIVNENGEKTDKIRQTEKITIRVHIQVFKEITSELGMGLTIKSLDSVSIASTNGKLNNQSLSPGEYWIDFVPDFLPLMPGIFTFRCLIGNNLYRLAYVDNLFIFTVLSRVGGHVLNTNSAFFEITGKIDLIDFKEVREE